MLRNICSYNYIIKHLFDSVKRFFGIFNRFNFSLPQKNAGIAPAKTNNIYVLEFVEVSFVILILHVL